MATPQLPTNPLGTTGLDITRVGFGAWAIWRKSDPWFTEPQLTQHLALVERLRAVADRHGVTPGAVAVAWTLRHPAVSGAITGYRRPDQVDPIVAAASLELTDADLAELAEPADAAPIAGADGA
jgi:aryl-alcohol dehydrogenase-like predicted oxidoreductase